MTTVLKTLEEITALRNKVHQQKQTMGFVPTMGNLHKGHESLLTKAKHENDLCLLSIFVNPTQFNDPADFTHYPRTLAADLTIAQQHQVDYVFLPTKEILYPDGYQYQLQEKSLSQLMEGKHRPGHFEGMLTVVMKLLQLTQPTRAYFGEKDFQQLQLIKDMTHAFFLDTKIIGCLTVRAANGLALSSRNSRLSREALELAPLFYSLLSSNNDCKTIEDKLTAAGFRVEYIEEHYNRRFGAVYLESVRLIDNVPIN